MSIKTIVIPVAGMGTRFLPATKSIPKEMLPILDKPLIHYAVEEAKNAGIKSFIFVTSPNNKFPKLYLSRNKSLETHLIEKGKKSLLKTVQEINIEDANIKLVEQKKPLGLGDAIYRTKKYIGKKDFAVLLPDDLILGSNCLKQLINIYNKKKAYVIGVMNVNKNEVEKYGVVKGNNLESKTSEVLGLIEKPKISNAPSNLAVVGRYILKNSIFNYLNTIDKGSGNELQLTDAISLSAQKERVLSYKFSGKRYDCGSKLGFLKAQIASGLSDSKIKKYVRKELKIILKENSK